MPGPTGCPAGWSIWASICAAARICWPRSRSQDVYQSRIEGMWPAVRDLLREHRDEIGTIRLEPTDGPELVVRLNERPEQADRAAASGAHASPRPSPA